ncbi:uncharacterized protein LOC133187942 [Saccostrea echinata]|uniref:uncharacterized protein LOC133187942 n=1 Tax=Saccostrea echinata TaxID=191078 RepID=UPI002A818F22|nr:uncharacterized protein LOC133187942 [Saccostrea echinata]
MRMNFRFEILLVFVTIPSIRGYTSTLYFDSTCSGYNTNTIFEDDTYYVTWSGSKLSSYCSYQFTPFDTDYKVCVEAQSFYIEDCSVKLQYYGGLIATELDETYSCYDSKPQKFCGDTYGDVKIKLTAPSKTSGIYSGYFTLKVTTQNPYEVGIVVGSVVGSIVFAIVVITVIIIICRRRRYHPHGVIIGTGGHQQVVTATATGYANPNYQAPPPYTGYGNPATGNIMNSYPPQSGYGTTPYPGTGTGQSNPYQAGTGYNGTGYPVEQTTSEKAPPYPGN